MKRLGDYELLRKIGSGGMAEVWMGRRAAMAGASKAVAIKLLARDLLDDPSYRQMFLEEARLSMLLTNSNVVQVFDVGEIDGECFMVMEWVDGLNLSELARKMSRDQERLSIVVAAHVVGEVLRGLAYAHGLHHDGSKATIVHRDVSPQNVLVSVSGEVKVADFGVARLASEETSGLHVKGKLRYMAPEQLRGRSREPTVDLYAVGAILHELIEGEKFRQTRDEGDLYSMVLSGTYPPLSVEVPPEVARLHAGLLEPDPTRRIQSADEALELLYSWPGYRNCSVELGRLVRKWIGVEAPRSGILNSEIIAAARAAGLTTQAESAVASAAETLDAPTRAASGPVGSAPVAAASGGEHSVVTAVESGPLADHGVTETRTFVETSPNSEATIAVASASARGSASSMLIVAAVTLALSFGVFGLGFPLGWWGGGEPEQAAAATQPQPSEDEEPKPPPVEPSGETAAKTPAKTPAEPSGDEVTPPKPAADAEVESDSQVAIAPKAEAEAQSAAQDQPEAEAKDEADKPAKKVEKPAGPPVTVRFVLAGNLFYAQVKVGGKQLSLEPQAELSLKPGKYTVKTRASADAQWSSAGSIRVESGKDLKVTMLKSGGLKTAPL